MGGVNPLEYIFPAVGLTHLAVEQGLNFAGRTYGSGNIVPPAPGSPSAKVYRIKELAEEARIKGVAKFNEEQEAQRLRIAQSLPQTAQDEYRARQRAAASYERAGLEGRRRRASDTLTEAGQPLSGAYL